MMNSNWEQTVYRELNQAQTARDSGNEGMARVCSRRAAGAAIGYYLAENGITDPGPSAIDRLHLLQTIPGIPAEALNATRLLTLRVDIHHNLPVEADLILEAQNLIKALFPDFQSQKE